jgi:hypothetical protein
MYKIILLFFALLILNSCSIFDKYDFNKKITLLKHEDYKDELLVRLYENVDYELLVPVNYLSDFLPDFGNEKSIDFVQFAEEFIKNNPNEFIIHYPNIGFEGGEHRLRVRDAELFISGKYLIYNRKTDTFVKKVLLQKMIKHLSSSSNSIDYWVYIDDIVFWERHYYVNADFPS